VLDALLGLVIVGLGVLILVAPSSVPGLTPAMPSMLTVVPPMETSSPHAS
jgi:hypothetical protein